MVESRSVLEGQRALVVGAGPGIGRSCAMALARDGADVAVAARRPEPLQALADEVAAAHGRRAVAVPGDISDPGRCGALVDATEERLGGIDIVVCVATTSGGHASVEDLDLDAWRAAFELNVLGTLEVSRCAAKDMRRRGRGSIVHVGTLAATSMPEKMAAYSSTKRAMMVASFTMARELGAFGVRVNVVTPGYTTGDNLDAMFQGIADRTGRSAADVSERAAAGAALRRHVDPEDIAEAVAFLVSPRARSITGVELRVDAGQVVG